MKRKMIVESFVWCSSSKRRHAFYFIPRNDIFNYLLFFWQYLFDSLKDTTVMKCGHTMHCECYNEMIKHDR